MVYLRVAVAVLVFSLVSSPATGEETTKFYVGASSKTLGYSLLWVGVKKGFFDQEGLDAQLLLLRGTTMTVQAIAGASLNVGSGNPEAFIEASERGLDLVMIGRRLIFSLKRCSSSPITRARAGNTTRKIASGHRTAILI